MKLIVMIIWGFFSICSIAQDQVKLLPLDNHLDLKELPQGVVIDALETRGDSLSPKERDKVLDRLFGKEISTYDYVDREILYKSILNYAKPKLLKKYPFIKDKDYEKVVNAFR